MKTYIAYCIPLLLIFGCDLGIEMDLNDIEFSDPPYMYSATVKVIDVNYEICYDAMVILEGDTVKHYPEQEFGLIYIFHTDSVENDPDEFSCASTVYMNRNNLTKFKQVDITFRRGRFHFAQIVQFDVAE